jgi:hypothetical protein
MNPVDVIPFFALRLILTFSSYQCQGFSMWSVSQPKPIIYSVPTEVKRKSVIKGFCIRKNR